MGRTSDARARLVESARLLIHAGGYEAVGVQEICDHAGVRKGSFYHFFPSKADLALAALEALRDQARELLLTMLGDADRPPLARIEALFRAAGQVQCRLADDGGKVLGCPFGNVSLEMGNRDDRLRRFIEGFFDEAIAVLAAVIDEAVRRGDLPPVDSEAAAGAVLSLFEGGFLMAKTRNRPDLVGDLAPAAVALIRGLAGGPAGPPGPNPGP